MLKLLRLLPALMAYLTFITGANAQAPYSMKDVPYVESGSVHQKLDLYVPSNVVQPPALIFYIHGGGWLRGDKGDVPPSLVNSGYAVASINCRPSSVAKYPAQFDDCLSALNWLVQHAAKYRYDADNIAVVGQSSGAHLAALLATKPNPVRARIKCVGDVSGPVDLAAVPAEAVLPGQVFFACDGGQIALFLGSPPRKNPAVAAAASPSTYVSAGVPPFFIIHGSNDEIVPLPQATKFNQKLVAAGVKTQLLIIPGSHSLPPESWTKPFIAFVSKFLPAPQTAHMEMFPHATQAGGYMTPYGQQEYGFHQRRHR